MIKFAEIDYRKILYDLSSEYKLRRGPQFNLGMIAKNCGVQNSYFSKMLALEAHLNEDQLYQICEYFELEKIESEFIFLLYRHQRSSHSGRKKKLKEEIVIFKNKHLRTENNVKATVIKEGQSEMNHYFLSPQIQIVHLLLEIERFQKDPKLIQNLLNMTTPQYESIVETLLNLKLIEQTDKGIKMLNNNLFLSKDSFIMPAYHTMMKAQAQGKINTLLPSEKYSLSMLFSCDDKVFDHMRDRFIQLIKELNQLARDSKETTDVYQVSIDLFPWT